MTADHLADECVCGDVRDEHNDMGECTVCECLYFRPEEARERLADSAACQNNVTAILTTLDALAVLIPPAEMLAAYERAGRVEQETHRDFFTGDITGYAWRIVDEEHRDR